MKLSIITINLNNRIGLKKTIQSVISQSFKDFEYIIIDGASKDDSVEEINQNAKNIDYWVSEPDFGIYNAMNKGIKKASGEYCLFLNSGDSLCKVTTLNEIFCKELTCDIIYGNSFMYNENNKEFLNEEPEKLTFLTFYKRSICHQALFIRRELFNANKLGLYREDFKIVSDWEFNLRAIILRECSIKYLPIPIVYVDNTGVSLTNRDLSLRERQMVFTELIPSRILSDYKLIMEMEEELLNIKKTKWFRTWRKIKKLLTF